MNCLIRHSRIGSFVLQCKPRCNVLQSVRNTFVVCIAIIVCHRLERSLSVVHDACKHSHAPRLATEDRGTSMSVIVRKVVDERDLYVMRRRAGPDDSVQWSVIVDDPLTALHIVRANWGPRARDLTKELVARGISFHTVESHATRPPNPPREPGHRLGLGMFPQQYKPGSDDYAAYETRRNELLLRGGHLRAALLKGGIVWRLAIDALGFDPALDGPIIDGALRLYVVNIDGRYAIDDDLSQAEEDLICGVCRVRTCKLCFTSRSLYNVF